MLSRLNYITDEDIVVQDASFYGKQTSVYSPKSPSPFDLNSNNDLKMQHSKTMSKNPFETTVRSKPPSKNPFETPPTPPKPFDLYDLLKNRHRESITGNPGVDSQRLRNIGDFIAGKTMDASTLLNDVANRSMLDETIGIVGGDAEFRKNLAILLNDEDREYGDICSVFVSLSATIDTFNAMHLLCETMGLDDSEKRQKARKAANVLRKMASTVKGYAEKYDSAANKSIAFFVEDAKTAATDEDAFCDSFATDMLTTGARTHVREVLVAQSRRFAAFVDGSAEPSLNDDFCVDFYFSVCLSVMLCALCGKSANRRDDDDESHYGGRVNVVTNADGGHSYANVVKGSDDIANDDVYAFLRTLFDALHSEDASELSEEKLNVAYNQIKNSFVVDPDGTRFHFLNDMPMLIRSHSNIAAYSVDNGRDIELNEQERSFVNGFYEYLKQFKRSKSKDFHGVKHDIKNIALPQLIAFLRKEVVSTFLFFIELENGMDFMRGDDGREAAADWKKSQSKKPGGRSSGITREDLDNMNKDIETLIETKLKTDLESFFFDDNVAFSVEYYANIRESLRDIAFEYYEEKSNRKFDRCTTLARSLELAHESEDLNLMQLCDRFDKVVESMVLKDANASIAKSANSKSISYAIAKWCVADVFKRAVMLGVSHGVKQMVFWARDWYKKTDQPQDTAKPDDIRVAPPTTDPNDVKIPDVNTIFKDFTINTIEKRNIQVNSAVFDDPKNSAKNAVELLMTIGKSIENPNVSGVSTSLSTIVLRPIYTQNMSDQMIVYIFSNDAAATTADPNIQKLYDTLPNDVTLSVISSSSKGNAEELEKAVYDRILSEGSLFKPAFDYVIPTSNPGEDEAFNAAQNAAKDSAVALIERFMRKSKNIVDKVADAATPKTNTNDIASSMVDTIHDLAVTFDPSVKSRLDYVQTSNEAFSAHFRTNIGDEATRGMFSRFESFLDAVISNNFTQNAVVSVKLMREKLNALRKSVENAWRFATLANGAMTSLALAAAGYCCTGMIPSPVLEGMGTWLVTVAATNIVHYVGYEGIKGLFFTPKPSPYSDKRSASTTTREPYGNHGYVNPMKEAAIDFERIVKRHVKELSGESEDERYVDNRSIYATYFETSQAAVNRIYNICNSIWIQDAVVLYAVPSYLTYLTLSNGLLWQTLGDNDTTKMSDFIFKTLSKNDADRMSHHQALGFLSGSNNEWYDYVFIGMVGFLIFKLGHFAYRSVKRSAATTMIKYPAMRVKHLNRIAVSTAYSWIAVFLKKIKTSFHSTFFTGWNTLRMTKWLFFYAQHIGMLSSLTIGVNETFASIVKIAMNATLFDESAIIATQTVDSFVRTLDAELATIVDENPTRSFFTSVFRFVSKSIAVMFSIARTGSSLLRIKAWLNVFYYIVTSKDVKENNSVILRKLLSTSYDLLDYVYATFNMDFAKANDSWYPLYLIVCVIASLIFYPLAVAGAAWAKNKLEKAIRGKLHRREDMTDYEKLALVLNKKEVVEAGEILIKSLNNVLV